MKTKRSYDFSPWRKAAPKPANKVRASNATPPETTAMAPQTADTRPAHKMVADGDDHRSQGRVEISVGLGEYIGEVKNSSEGKPVATDPWNKTYEADKFRKSNYIHLSDLMGKCHRMLALINLFDIHPAPLRIFDQSIVMYAMGNMLHDEARRRWAKNAPDQAYGFWRCGCKKTCVEGTKTFASSIVCPHCGAEPEEYMEVRLVYETIKVGHSVDFMFLLPDGSIRVVEIKSCTKEDYLSCQTSKRAKVEHVVQAATYWRAARSAGYDVDAHVSIFYVCKEYMTDGQGLEIVHAMNDKTAANLTDPLYARTKLISVKAIDGYRGTLTIPEKDPACNVCDSSKARYCHTAGLCFALPEDGVINGNFTVTKYKD